MPHQTPRHHHIAHRASLDWGRTREHLRDVDSLPLSRYRQFNAKVAITINNMLGSMEGFWFACLLAFLSLPAVLAQVIPGLRTIFPEWLIKASLISLVAWLAQTFIQLVALFVLQVSGNAQARQLEESVHTILDWMSFETEGGAAEIREEIRQLREAIVGPQTPKRTTRRK